VRLGLSAGILLGFNVRTAVVLDQVDALFLTKYSWFEDHIDLSTSLNMAGHSYVPYAGTQVIYAGQPLYA
jgi:hypothetical protein